MIKTVTFKLSDMAAIPDLINQALDAGANCIESIKFNTSNLRKFKDEARVLALRAAKEKAEQMAQELSRHIGKPVVIAEESSELTGQSSEFFGNAANNINRLERRPELEPSPLAPGMLTVGSSVTVTFELID